MVLIDGPVEFDMGSPPSEPTRGDFETIPPSVHPPAIRHRFQGGDRQQFPEILDGEAQEAASIRGKVQSDR